MYNLFAILTVLNFDDCFLNSMDEKPIWHLDWINREYFVSRLFECTQTEQYRALFADRYYMDNYCPDYDVEKRALLSFIKISSTLIRYLSYPYYEDYQSTFILLLKALVSVQTNIIDDDKSISTENFEFISDVIDTIEPIFRNCCPINKNGDYSSLIDRAQYSCVAEGFDYEEYPFTTGLCAYNSLWTYYLYKVVNSLLLIWIFTAQKEKKADSIFKSRKSWQKEISVELYRIDKGFNHFFDFYGETPKYYGGKNDINEELIAVNSTYVDNGFDESPEDYVSQIMNTLQSTKQPFYLYSLLLNANFPLTDVTYDLLFDNNIGKVIANDNRLTNNQKIRLFKKAFHEYIDFSEDFNSTDTKRMTSSRMYDMNDDIYIVETKDPRKSMDLCNHIVVVWYQVIRELMLTLKLPKQFMSKATRMVQKKYIESVGSLFDIELYNEYNRAMLKDIPEFSNNIDSAMYELFNKDGFTEKCSEAILAEVIYAFSNGETSVYNRAQVVKAINDLADSILLDCDLSNLLLQL